MNADIFNGRHICLVLSCNREFYNKRRVQNAQTFAYLKSFNFVIVYLFADNSIDTVKIQKMETDTYNMIVPAPEMYELLSYKMNVAYDYFSKVNVKGILKIDDNTCISFPDIIEHDFMDLVGKYDYIGLERVERKKSKDTYIKFMNRTDVPLLRNIYNKLDMDITYFGGPFYYLSPKAITQVANVGLLFGYEDLSVGYAVCKNPALKHYMWNFKNKGISWDNNSEVDPYKLAKKYLT